MFIQTSIHPSNNDIGKLVSFVEGNDFHVYEIKEFINKSVRDIILFPDLTKHTFDNRQLVLTIDK